MNALNNDLLHQLLREERKWYSGATKDANVPRFLLMYGNGRAFSAGGDLKMLYFAKTFREWHLMFRQYHLNSINMIRLNYGNYGIGHYPATSLITLWNGYTAGAGNGISFYAPVRIATEDT